MSSPLPPPDGPIPPEPPQESQQPPRVPPELSIHLARTEAWMHDALDSANMLGWEYDIAADRWSTTTDVPNFFGAPRGPDYKQPAASATVIHPDDFAYVVAKRREAIETGQPMRYEFRGNFPAADGSVRWFTTRGRALRDASGKPVRLLGVTSDVTERKRAEQARAALDQQLLDAQKWESLGVLAGGVAHDFNNILTIILGSAGLARRGLSTGSNATVHLEQIEQASRRAGDLCRQLLAYTGRGPVAAASADPNELIRSSAALFGVQVSESARVRYELADNLPAICADPAQAKQVLINLAMNAAEAVGDNPGEICIATSAVEVSVESNVGYHLPPTPGKYVRLMVSDTGPGIPPEVKTQMFDPFFTTKFAGRGLGLSAVLGIMRLHDGAIRVTSVPGRTTMEVLWPVITDVPASATGSRPIPQPVPRLVPKPGTHGKALVIDDEMYVRELAASVLQELGYEVLLAGDGATALGLFQKHSSDIRLAVLDIMMPGMTGDQVLDALRVLRPKLPAVIISGFTDRRTITAAAGSRTEFLQKPFHPEEMIAVVERLMKPKK